MNIEYYKRKLKLANPLEYESVMEKAYTDIDIKPFQYRILRQYLESFSTIIIDFPEEKNMKTHKTREGQEMFISQMTDAHLDAIIKLYLKKLNEAKSLLVKGQTVDKFKSAIYNVDTKINEKALKSIIHVHSEGLCYYITEAMLRGKSYTTELQEYYDRIGQEDFQMSNSLQLLDSSNISDFDETETTHEIKTDF